MMNRTLGIRVTVWGCSQRPDQSQEKKDKFELILTEFSQLDPKSRGFKTSLKHWIKDDIPKESRSNPGLFQSGEVCLTTTLKDVTYPQSVGLAQR